MTEVGPDITNLALGDLVVIPFNISCGRGPDAVIDAVGMEAHGADEAAACKLGEVAQPAAGLLPDGVAQNPRPPGRR